MKWLDKRYHSYNYELKKIFGEKVYKLSLDGGFSCPNRDGSIGTKGCIFCSEKGSGDFAGNRNISIEEQCESQKKLIYTKSHANKYIAYFQAYSSTYSNLEYLKSVYDLAINTKDVVGLSIATRPDCINDDIINLLSYYNDKTYLSIELGLQTIHDKTATLIRRAYTLDTFINTLNKLRKANINVITHLIFSLPYESKEDMLDSVKFISNLDIQGVKFHMLYILKNTELHKLFLDNKFNLLSRDDYIDIVVESLNLLNENIVIHRLTGDPPKDLLLEPKWTTNKRAVLNAIDKELVIRDTYQGKNIK